MRNILSKFWRAAASEATDSAACAIAPAQRRAAATVNPTIGAAVEATAGDVLTASDRALKRRDANDVVSVTVFEGNNGTVSVR